MSVFESEVAACWIAVVGMLFDAATIDAWTFFITMYDGSEVVACTWVDYLCTGTSASL